MAKRDTFICIKGKMSQKDIDRATKLLMAIFNLDTVAATSDIEVLNDWNSDLPYSEKKQPKDNDWWCIAGCEESEPLQSGLPIIIKSS